jgi:hypothetical protein
MKYAPGSFSKNFAWHGTGLRKLHTVIRDGFHDTLAPVQRQRFRDNSGLDDALSLIPINFFLHNRGGQISVDELAFQAIERPHSIRFDRLGLFALHLNRVGKGTGVVERPAMWVNEFVRERLWLGGAWRASALPDASLDPFLADRMAAQDDVRVKCRNNYRHLFELCEFWPSSLPIINSGAEQWIASALFLAWDRHILDGGADDKASMLALIDSDEIYKLLGVTRPYANAQASDLADLYISIGRLDRFKEATKLPAPDVPAPPEPAPELPEEEGLEWLEQEESDEVVKRHSVERQQQNRDRKKAAALKQHYDNTCMFCGTKLQIAENRFYSEAAHIKGLGEPHSGPDKASNMLVLCPNHHLQFDRGVLRLHKLGAEYRIKSKTAGDPLHGRAITPTHPIDNECVKYHHNWFDSKRT